MKRAFVALAAFLCLGVSGPADPDEIQRALDARVAGMPGSGIVAAVIDHGRLTIYRAGVSGTARPLDDNTLFEIGSDTKTFTSTVLAEMVREGKVKLSDPVQKYLPSTVHVPSRNGKEITLLNLATQHSGLPRLPSNLGTAANPYATYDAAKLYAFLNGYTLTRDPGAAFEYSNLGVGLLGFALARANHSTYEQLVRSYVWRPLHMTGTAIDLDAAEKARLAQGHDADGQPAPPWDFGEPIVGAGGIRSDIVDMAKYLAAVMGRGTLGSTLLFAERPRATFPGHHIGLIWWTNDSSHFIDHGGDTAGYHAEVLMNGDRTRGVVLLSNGPAVSDIASYIIDTTYALVPPQSSLALSTTQLDAYTGTYANNDLGMTYKITRSGSELDAQIVGQPSVPIYASMPDHFYYKVAPATIEFVRNDGTVVGLILTQNGRHVPVYRIGADGKAMAAELTPAFPPTVALAPEVLAQYAGTYDFMGTPYVLTIKDGHVFARLGSQDAFEIHPSAKDAFFYEDVDAQVTFQRDADGKVVGLTLIQYGRSTPAKKQP